MNLPAITCLTAITVVLSTLFFLWTTRQTSK